jgi:glycerol-3-phosphate O-acyltransferase
MYYAIFTEYVNQLLRDNQAIEFFIEGTRSRTGKMLHPKVGLL